MAKDPAFLFYSSDFLSGVMDLDMEERGQYITLLCAQHQKGPLSEKTIRLLVGSISVSVLDKFQKTDEGLFFNARLSIEIENRIAFTESRKLNGSKGGRPKKETYEKPNGYALAKASENLPENENENRIETGIEVRKESLRENQFQIPDQAEIYDFVLHKYPSANIQGALNFADKFWSHYENNGWKVGKNKMKNWKLAISSWSETLQKELFPQLAKTGFSTQPEKKSARDAGMEALQRLMNQPD
jgi:uncharacterized protein YdaU (DUF1376 family)